MLSAAVSTLALALMNGAQASTRLAAGAACFVFTYAVSTAVLRKDFVLRVKAHLFSS
jgi:hypothetical protein